MWSDIDGEDVALLVALVVATGAALLDTFVGSAVFKALKMLSLILSLGLAIHRIRTGRPYVKDLTVSDWTAVGQRYQVHVPRRVHGRGSSPRTLCLVPGDLGGFTEAFWSAAEVNDTGDVFVVSNEPAVMRLDIRKA